VIAGNHIDKPHLKPLPKGFIVLHRPERGAYFRQRALFLEHLVCQAKILRARLREDNLAFIPCFSDGIKGTRCAHMNDIKRTIHDLGNGNGSEGGIRFQDVRPNLKEDVLLGLIPIFILKIIDGQSVLCMDHCQSSQLGDHIHRFGQIVIIRHPSQLGIGHEHLKRPYAHFKTFRRILDLIFWVKHSAMDGKIGV